MSDIKLLNLKCYVSKVSSEEQDNYDKLIDLGLKGEDEQPLGELIITNVLLDVNDISFIINTDEQDSCTLVTKHQRSMLIANKTYLLNKLDELKVVL